LLQQHSFSFLRPIVPFSKQSLFFRVCSCKIAYIVRSSWMYISYCQQKYLKCKFGHSFKLQSQVQLRCELLYWRKIWSMRLKLQLWYQKS
jgi:hypothetical protein